jgi:hypothetical protein
MSIPKIYADPTQLSLNNMISFKFILSARQVQWTCKVSLHKVCFRLGASPNSFADKAQTSNLLVTHFLDTPKEQMIKTE